MEESPDTDFDYLKLLLESSFKESEEFWTRYTAVSLVQGVLIGFFIYSLDKSIEFPLIFLFVSVVGIILSFLHLLMLEISQHYNQTWFCHGVKPFIENKIQNYPDIYKWKIFNEIINRHVDLVNVRKEKMKRYALPLIDAPKIAKYISVLFLVIWFGFTIFILQSTYHLIPV